MTEFFFDAPATGPELPRYEATDLLERNMRWRLFRHVQAPRAVVESWLLTDGSYTLVAPSDPSTILLHFRAGRVHLTPRQAALLLEAGQTVILPDGVTQWDPAAGLTWAQAAQLTWSDLSFFPWSLL